MLPFHKIIYNPISPTSPHNVMKNDTFLLFLPIVIIKSTFLTSLAHATKNLFFFVILQKVGIVKKRIYWYRYSPMMMS